MGPPGKGAHDENDGRRSALVIMQLAQAGQPNPIKNRLYREKSAETAFLGPKRVRQDSVRKPDPELLGQPLEPFGIKVTTE